MTAAPGQHPWAAVGDLDEASWAPELFGRDDELQQLTQALASAWSGRATTVIVRGARTSGRTSLLQAFAERAAGQGAIVVPWSVAADSIPARERRSRGRSNEAVPAGWRQRLSDSIAADAPPHQLLSQIESLAQSLNGLTDRAMVLIADDVHRLDPRSRTALALLIRRCPRARLLVVLTAPTEAGRLAEFDSPVSPTHQELTLGGLDAIAQTQLLTTVLGRSPAPDLLDQLAVAAGPMVGLPGLYVGLIRLIEDRGQLVDVDQVAHRVGTDAIGLPVEHPLVAALSTATGGALLSALAAVGGLYPREYRYFADHLQCSVSDLGTDLDHFIALGVLRAGSFGTIQLSVPAIGIALAARAGPKVSRLADHLLADQSADANLDPDVLAHRAERATGLDPSRRAQLLLAGAATGLTAADCADAERAAGDAAAGTVPSMTMASGALSARWARLAMELATSDQQRRQAAELLWLTDWSGTANRPVESGSTGDADQPRRRIEWARHHVGESWRLGHWDRALALGRWVRAQQSRWPGANPDPGLIDPSTTESVGSRDDPRPTVDDHAAAIAAVVALILIERGELPRAGSWLAALPSTHWLATIARWTFAAAGAEPDAEAATRFAVLQFVDEASDRTTSDDGVSDDATGELDVALAVAGELLLQWGDRPAAERALARLDHRSARARSGPSLMSAAVLRAGVVGDVDSAQAALDDARARRQPAAQARAHELLARAGNQPDEHLRQAYELYRDLGAEHRRQLIADQLRAAGLPIPRRRTGNDGQLQHERRLLDLLARGLTNRQLAGALRISEKTVESQISRLLTRYQCRTRVELVAAHLTDPRPELTQVGT